MLVQLTYVNGFDSIWEYVTAFEQQTISWEAAVGPRCPICGGAADYAPIPAYVRGVATLWPCREGHVWIARFRCRKTGRTFSLLPCQLVPYHRYTVDSILGALLLAAQLQGPRRAGLSRSPGELPPDSTVCRWLLFRWLHVAVRGLRRAHAVLAQGRELGAVRSGDEVADQLIEVAVYVGAFAPCGRGPPSLRAVRRLLAHYQHRSQATHFLLGTPSQQRGA